MSEERRKPDLAGAAVALGFAAVGALAVVQSLAMTTLGAIFPRTVGGVLIGLAAVQIALSLGGRGGQGGGEGADTSWDGLGRRLTLVAIMLAWAILFPLVGFVVTSVAAALGLLFVAEHEQPPLAMRLLRIAVVVAMVAVFYWLMVRVLYIPMPRGWLI
jgi:putative tricarboxylic transport membrane protein